MGQNYSSCCCLYPCYACCKLCYGCCELWYSCIFLCKFGCKYSNDLPIEWYEYFDNYIYFLKRLVKHEETLLVKIDKIEQENIRICKLLHGLIRYIELLHPTEDIKHKGINWLKLQCKSQIEFAKKALPCKEQPHWCALEYMRFLNLIESNKDCIIVPNIQADIIFHSLIYNQCYIDKYYKEIFRHILSNITDNVPNNTETNLEDVNIDTSDKTQIINNKNQDRDNEKQITYINSDGIETKWIFMENKFPKILYNTTYVYDDDEMDCGLFIM
jgi:hypothetical protein